MPRCRGSAGGRGTRSGAPVRRRARCSPSASIMTGDGNHSADVRIRCATPPHQQTTTSACNRADVSVALHVERSVAQPFSASLSTTRRGLWTHDSAWDGARNAKRAHRRRRVLLHSKSLGNALQDFTPSSSASAKPTNATLAYVCARSSAHSMPLVSARSTLSPHCH